VETALVLLVPQAEPLVLDWRQLYDPAAAEGVPAHVTVLVPFMDYERIDDACSRTLRDAVAGTAALDLVFSEIRRFPGTLWLAPEPAKPIAALTERLTARFPDYPIYGGAFAEIVPHLTIAQGDDGVLDKVEAAVRPRLQSPIRARVESCALFAHKPGQWQQMRNFPLGR
jgi:2'-5' RNA ligase